MKRFIALALVMAMALSLFAGCAKEETTTTAAPSTEATTAATEAAPMTEAEELEAMKKENEICAPADGKVVSVAVKKGDTVDTGSLMVVIG